MVRSTHQLLCSLSASTHVKFIVIYLTCIMSVCTTSNFFFPELVVITYSINVAVLLQPTSVSAEKQEKICIALPLF